MGIVGRSGQLAAPAPPGGSDERTVTAVGGEDAVEAGQVDSGRGHHSGQPGDEIQRLEDHVRGAIAVGGFQAIAQVAVGQQTETFSETAGRLM